MYNEDNCKTITERMMLNDLKECEKLLNILRLRLWMNVMQVASCVQDIKARIKLFAI